MRLHDPHMPTVKAEFFECSHVLPSGIKVCHFIRYMWLCSYRSQKESRPVWSEKFKGGGGLIWVSLRWSDQGPHEAGGEAVWPGFISWIRAEGERGESVIKLEKAGVWKKSLVWPHIWTCVPYWSSFHCVCGSLTCLNFTEVEDRSTQKLHFLFRSVDHYGWYLSWVQGCSWHFAGKHTTEQASQMVQQWRIHLPSAGKTWVQSLGQEDPLE